MSFRRQLARLGAALERLAQPAPALDGDAIALALRELGETDSKPHLGYGDLSDADLFAAREQVQHCRTIVEGEFADPGHYHAICAAIDAASAARMKGKRTK